MLTPQSRVNILFHRPALSASSLRCYLGSCVQHATRRLGILCSNGHNQLRCYNEYSIMLCIIGIYFINVFFFACLKIESVKCFLICFCKSVQNMILPVDCVRENSFSHRCKKLCALNIKPVLDLNGAILTLKIDMTDLNTTAYV